MLIEIRLSPGKWKLKNKLAEVRKNTGLHSKIPKVPHVSLYGPFNQIGKVDKIKYMETKNSKPIFW